jgi:hypothetical protein
MATITEVTSMGEEIKYRVESKHDACTVLRPSGDVWQEPTLTIVGSWGYALKAGDDQGLETVRFDVPMIGPLAHVEINDVVRIEPET